MIERYGAEQPDDSGLKADVIKAITDIMPLSQFLELVDLLPLLPEMDQIPQVDELIALYADRSQVLRRQQELKAVTPSNLVRVAESGQQEMRVFVYQVYETLEGMAFAGHMEKHNGFYYYIDNRTFTALLINYRSTAFQVRISMCRFTTPVIFDEATMDLLAPSHGNTSYGLIPNLEHITLHLPTPTEPNYSMNSIDMFVNVTDEVRDAHGDINSDADRLDAMAKLYQIFLFAGMEQLLQNILTGFQDAHALPSSMEEE